MQMTEKQKRHVPGGLYRSAAFFDYTASLWKCLAGLESAVLRDQIDAIRIDRPIYVAGVARSGSTILTEILAGHPQVTCHRYSDFPNVYTPYWRNWLADRIGRDRSPPAERAHRDRIKVNRESPEAVEEVLWMQFFEGLHDPQRSHVLDEHTSNPAFERFYMDHIRKLLLVRGAARYLTKGNYNTTRIRYLLKLFPDARILVPVREPVAHIASLIKQDRLFTRLAAEDPRVPAQLHRSGHFEFGPDKRPVHAGNADRVAAICAHWAAGRLVEGWSLYWVEVYAHVASLLEERGLSNVVFVVRYDALCADPRGTLDAVLAHAGLDPGPYQEGLEQWIERIEPPDYYRPDFDERELQTIRVITGPVWSALTS